MKYSEEERLNYIQNHKEFNDFLKNKEILNTISLATNDSLNNMNIEDNEITSIKNQLKANKVYHWIVK